MPADNGRFCLFAQIRIGTPIEIWHWPTSRPSTERPCHRSQFGEGELYCIVSQRAFSYPSSALWAENSVRRCSFQTSLTCCSSAVNADGCDMIAPGHCLHVAQPFPGERALRRDRRVTVECRLREQGSGVADPSCRHA